MHEIIAGKRPSLVFAGFVYLVFILVLLVTVNKSPAMKAEAYNDGVLHPLPLYIIQHSSIENHDYIPSVEVAL